MTRYIGLDAHAKSCTFGVIDDSGRRLKHAVVETDAKCLVEFVKTVSRPRYVCLEDGIHLKNGSFVSCPLSDKRVSVSAQVM